MSKSYTPGLKVLEKTSIEKERILPLSGNVHVKINEEVSHDDIVASTKIPGNVQMINIANQLNLFWGVHTLILEQLDSVDGMIEGCQRLLRDRKIIKKKQKFVFIAGIPVGIPGSTNLLKVHEIN